MTGKQRYDERRRLRSLRLLREEERAANHRQREEDFEAQETRVMTVVERIADVLEMWADQQVDKA